MKKEFSQMAFNFPMEAEPQAPPKNGSSAHQGEGGNVLVLSEEEQHAVREEGRRAGVVVRIKSLKRSTDQPADPVTGSGTPATSGTSISPIRTAPQAKAPERVFVQATIPLGDIDLPVVMAEIPVPVPELPEPTLFDEVQSPALVEMASESVAVEASPGSAPAEASPARTLAAVDTAVPAAADMSTVPAAEASPEPALAAEESPDLAAVEEVPHTALAEVATGPDSLAASAPPQANESPAPPQSKESPFLAQVEEPPVQPQVKEPPVQSRFEEAVPSLVTDSPASPRDTHSPALPEVTAPAAHSLEEPPFPPKRSTPRPAAAKAKPAPAEKTKSKRGRKSLKEVAAEADLIDIPEDEVLFSKQYYTMGEVAEMFRVNQSLLRFWETEFSILQPRKNRKGDRYFRPIDIKNLHLIYHLLRQRKYTIEGAKEFLRKNKKAEQRFEAIQRLQQIKAFLLELKAQL